MIQQGDVLFYRVKDIPQNAEQVEADCGRLIFARGEATGHHHSVAEDCGGVLFKDAGGTLWFSIDESVEVQHQEHNAVTLAPGKYKIGIVREVDPFEEEIRNVAD